jgi:arsenate reductase-like glutaredoxin family protein
VSVTVYGIPTCDTCRQALKALKAAGRAAVLRDVRAEPLSEAEWAELVAEFGDRLVNRSSASYRSFSPFLREAEAEAQLAAQPTVMKRPVIRADGRLFLGWGPEVQAALTGG